MFNHIRKVPYVAADGKGGVSYFAGGFQNQFGLETQIVAAMCEFNRFPFKINLFSLHSRTVLLRLDILQMASSPLPPFHSRSKFRAWPTRGRSRSQSSSGAASSWECTRSC